ncbi:MAG: sodium/solute symporter [Planctomycetaceae bacterium]|nr:sodium/solute symporter [Planctomycetaceae bacterium]
MTWVDWSVIGAYFAILFGLAWWVIRQNRNTADDYFLAGRNLSWWIIGGSIFASNIGSEHLVGLAGSGTTDGVAMAHYELHAWCLLVLAWLLVPFYMRSRVFTMPEFLERRFNPTSRWVLSLITLVAYIVTKLAVGIFAGGVVFQVLLPEMRVGPLNSFWVGSILVVVLTGVYTILGGLRAVAYTEALQTGVLVLGSLLVTVFGLIELGGWSELRRICGSEMFNLWKPLVPAGVDGTWAPVKEAGRMAWYFNDNYPWLSMLFCAPVIGLWYWCTDQYIVQRALGAPNETEARRGAICAAYLKLLPVFIFIIPGMICFALAKSGQNAALQQIIMDGEGQVIRDQAQQAFPLLVAHALPVGVRGMVVAGLLAALMSSLAGAFNASATLFTIDFYSKIHQNVTQHQLVWIGRVATAVMVLIGLLWIPVIQGGKGLYDYLQGVQAYLAPPIFTVFFLGVFWKRLNGAGCLAALLVGFVMGLFRLAVDTPVKLIEGFQYTEGSFLWIVNNTFFQYYSILILIVSAVVMIVVSYATRPPDYESISGLTLGTVTDEHRRASRSSWGTGDVVASLGVLVAILAAYLYFTG